MILEGLYPHWIIFILISTIIIIFLLIFCRYYEIGFNTLEEHTLVLCGELCIDKTKFV